MFLILRLPLSAICGYVIFPNLTKPPNIGVNYYHIKQIDIDGQYSYSNIASVSYDGDGREIAIYPNPATEDECGNDGESTQKSDYQQRPKQSKSVRIPIGIAYLCGRRPKIQGFEGVNGELFTLNIRY